MGLLLSSEKRRAFRTSNNEENSTSSLILSIPRRISSLLGHGFKGSKNSKHSKSDNRQSSKNSKSIKESSAMSMNSKGNSKNMSAIAPKNSRRDERKERREGSKGEAKAGSMERSRSRSCSRGSRSSRRSRSRRLRESMEMAEKAEELMDIHHLGLPRLGGTISNFRFREIQVKAYSSVLNRLNRPSLSEKSIGCFVALRPPILSIAKYLKRLKKYMSPSSSIFIVALVFVDRLLVKGSCLVMHELTFHRIVFIALMVAMKFYEDDTLNNARCAKIGGVPLKELNHMELVFVMELEFDLHVSHSTYVAYVNCLQDYAGVLEERMEQGMTPIDPYATSPLEFFMRVHCIKYNPRYVDAFSPAPSAVCDPMSTLGAQSYTLSSSDSGGGEDKMKKKAPNSMISSLRLDGDPLKGEEGAEYSLTVDAPSPR